MINLIVIRIIQNSLLELWFVNIFILFSLDEYTPIIHAHALASPPQIQSGIDIRLCMWRMDAYPLDYGHILSGHT